MQNPCNTSERQNSPCGLAMYHYSTSDISKGDINSEYPWSVLDIELSYLLKYAPSYLFPLFPYKKEILQMSVVLRISLIIKRSAYLLFAQLLLFCYLYVAFFPHSLQIHPFK